MNEIKQLKEILNNAYAPYSNFRVAAILKTKDGQIFSGVNVENASFGATICAERNAILSAITAGCKPNQFLEMHILGETKNILPPCSLCRQVMVEFFDEDTKIIMWNKKDNKKIVSLKELVPYKFSKDELYNV